MIKRRRRMDKAKRKLRYGDKKSKLSKSTENTNSIEQPIESPIKLEQSPIENALVLEQLETTLPVESLKQSTVKKTKNGRRLDIKTIDKLNGGRSKKEKSKPKRRSVDESKNKEKTDKIVENTDEDDVKEEVSISKSSKKSKQRYKIYLCIYNIFFL